MLMDSVPEKIRVLVGFHEKPPCVCKSAGFDENDSGISRRWKMNGMDKIPFFDVILLTATGISRNRYAWNSGKPWKLLPVNVA